MYFEEALSQEIGKIIGLTGKVFPLHAPKGTIVPYAFYLGAGGNTSKDFKGYTGTTKAFYEINIVAKTYSSLKYLEKAVIEKIKSFQSRDIGDGSIFIGNISYEEPAEIYEDQVNLLRANIQITVIYWRN